MSTAWAPPPISRDGLRPALDIIDKAMAAAPKATAPTSSSTTAGVTGAAVAKIIGHQGEQNGQVYKITIGRPDIPLREHGALINARMGLNTWAAFAGTDADAMVAGDVAMLDHEVTPVLKALRAHGLDVVAIHHHMTGTAPVVIFLHYFGVGTGGQAGAGRARRRGRPWEGPVGVVSTTSNRPAHDRT